jgi:hypothetical protein
MIPAVTLFSNPSGLPIAIASVPTSGSARAKTAADSRSRSSLTTAISNRSVPARTRAGNPSPFASTTWTAVDSPTTCWFVITKPSSR